MSGNVVVCDSSQGPGALNLGIGIGSAWIDSTPRVIISGDRRIEWIEKGAFHHVDLLSIYRPITKWNAMLTIPNEVYHIMRMAYRIAVSGRPGPVHVVVPDTILSSEVKNEDISINNRNHYRPF